MSFSRDVRRYAPTPRTLQGSRFGPYSRLTVEQKYNANGWAWAIGYGLVIGSIWFVIVAIKAGAV